MHFTRCFCIQVCLVWLCFLAVDVQAQNPGSRPGEAGLLAYQNFTPAEYGMDWHSQNWSVAQDDRSFLYAANGKGVLQYDGVSWRLIPVGNGAYTRVVMQGPDDTIYVGAQGEMGYLAADSSGVLHYVSLVEHIDPAVHDFGTVWLGAQTSDGLYFQARDVLFRWDGEAMRHWTSEDGARFGRIYAVRDTLYVLQWGRGLKRIAGDTLEMVPDGEQFADAEIDAMLPYGETQMLLASYKEGLSLFDGRTRQPFQTDANAFLIEKEIYSGLLLPDGTYAFGTLRGGVLLMDADGNVRRVLDERIGLAGQDIKRLFMDRQGGLWLAMETGLARVDVYAPATQWDKTTGLEGAVYIVARHEGTLYAGTATGLRRLMPRTSSTAPTVNEFIPVDNVGSEVFGLLSTPHGLLVGTTSGIYVVNGNDGQLIDKVGDAYAFAASKQDDTRVYVAFRGGLRELRYRQGQWHLLENVEALHGTELHYAYEDDAGMLWVGSSFDGLWRIDPTDELRSDTPVHRLNPEEGYPEKVHQILSFQGETRIVSDGGFLEPEVASDGAVTFVPDTTFQVYTVSGFLQVLEAPDGAFWLHPISDPMIRLEPQPDGSMVSSSPMAQVANWVSYGTYLDSDGIYWSPGPRGLMRLELRPPVVPEVPFRTFVRNVRTVVGDSVIFGGSSVVPETETRLAHTANALRFEYAAPSYTLASETTYQVRLGGFDKQWSEWTGETRKDYTNLPPGDYIFQVRARDYAERTSEEATYAFTMLPPWYRSGWAYAAYLLLGVGMLIVGGVGLVRWRSSKLEAQNRELEQTIAARTQQISKQNERLERQNTQLKEQKEQIEGQAHRLQEMNEVKTRFFTNISHEFRTPLTLMMGPLENVLSSTPGDRIQIERAPLETSLRNARRLLHLINQLLDLAKLDAGRMTLHADRRDFVAFLRILTAGFASLAQQRGITLTFEAEPDYLDARFDAEKLEMVFSNLFSNALKFTPEEGAVAVTLSQEDGSAVVSVQDSGIGIPGDELPHIFDRFHQVNSTLARSYEGTGIGLALVQNLVTLHHGTVTVESTEGAGTTFHVRLPILIQDQSALEENHSDRTPVAHRANSEAALYLPVPTAPVPLATQAGEEDAATVIIVEDNAEMRAYIADCLDGAYHIVEAADGQEALVKMRTTPPDLVITDLMMPYMDGYGLIKALRQDEVHARVPVLMLTARASDQATVDALEAGADDYLAKPFKARELRARVQNMLALHEQERALQALNQTLERTNELLWQESEAKTQLLGMASHDLRNPLAGIIGFASLLAEELDLSTEQGEFVDLIRSNAQRMHDLIEDLLNSVAIESGRVSITRQRLNLASLAQWVVRSLRSQAELKQQQLRYTAPAAPCIVEGDEVRLREALTNLLTNAIKYSPIGKSIEVEVFSADGECAVAVRDVGPGLSEEEQKLLFQPFQRLTPRPTNGEPSTGLGLYIVRQLMTLHAGRVVAESKEGVGSTFTLRLPSITKPPPAMPPLPGPEAAGSQPSNPL